MNLDDIEILYEDNHLLAVVKPAGILSMGDETGDPTMVDFAREYLRDKYSKPGNVFVGVVHRLDRPVSGILLFARTSKAAGRLSDQFRRNAVTKHYKAVVEGTPDQPNAELVDWLVKDPKTNIVTSVPEGTPGAKHSILSYKVLSAKSGRAILLIEPQTGRSHQIRVQLASRGLPIVGDVKYGAMRPGGSSIWLHAHKLQFSHPTKKTPIEIHSAAPFKI